MAKTVWGDGSHLTPDLQNTYWGTTANTGHLHDGSDSDGHCPKISAVDLSDFATGTFQAAISLTYMTPDTTATWSYYKIGKMTVVTTADMTGTSATSSYMAIHPVTTWPAAVIPAADSTVTAVLYGDGKLANGLFGIRGGSNSDAIDCFLPNDTGDCGLANFSTSINKGVRKFNYTVITA